uniref:Uncharacterized protein n=1 Tax=Knipowitschia caucasica TaxID=637954 RepID=A0AAV2K379_KNICA
MRVCCAGSGSFSQVRLCSHPLCAKLRLPLCASKDSSSLPTAGGVCCALFHTQDGMERVVSACPCVRRFGLWHWLVQADSGDLVTKKSDKMLEEGAEVKRVQSFRIRKM